MKHYDKINDYKRYRTQPADMSEANFYSTVWANNRIWTNLDYVIDTYEIITEEKYESTKYNQSKHIFLYRYRKLNELEHLLLHIFHKITPWGHINIRLEEHQTIKT